MSHLRPSSECGPLALHLVKSLRKSLSLAVPTTVVEAQKQIGGTIRTFADDLRL